MNEFDLLAMNQVLDRFLFCAGNFLIVASEELDVTDSVGVMRVLKQILENTLKDDLGLLVVQFIIGVDPTRVHVRMRDEVHCYLSCSDATEKRTNKVSLNHANFLYFYLILYLLSP